MPFKKPLVRELTPLGKSVAFEIVLWALSIRYVKEEHPIMLETFCVTAYAVCL